MKLTASMMMPQVLAITQVMFPPHERGFAFSLFGLSAGLASVAGPLVGGLLGDISWRGPFFGVAALMAIALVATVVLLDPPPKPTRTTSGVAPVYRAVTLTTSS